MVPPVGRALARIGPAQAENTAAAAPAHNAQVDQLLKGALRIVTVDRLKPGANKAA